MISRFNRIRRLRPTVLALGLSAALSACSLTPELVRPEAPVAQTFADSGSTKEGPAASEIGWRQFFRDPRLQALIATALENNRDLRTAAYRVEEARALYNVQNADLLPTINATGTAGRSRTPTGLTGLGRPTVISNYQIGLSLSAFELDFFGRVRSLSEAALSSFLATEEAQRAARITLVSQVATAYLSERSAAEQLALAESTMKARQESVKLTKQRFDVGASSALDLRQAEILLQQAQIAQYALARQQAQARNALELLVGAPIGNNLPPAAPLAEQSMVSDIPPGLPSDLLVRRPDIRAAEQRLRSANANIGAARAAFFPRISLTSGIGLGSNELSTLMQGDSRSWNFTPQLVLPLFDYGRVRSNLSLAEARKNLAVVDYERSIQVAFREVSDALVARGFLEQQLEAQRQTVQAELDRANLAEQRYRNGIASSLDLLDAQRELFSSQQALIQTWQLRFTNAVDLYRSLGGGLLESNGPVAGR
jgi:outer membrane protein, multidrug efflux system